MIRKLNTLLARERLGTITAAEQVRLDALYAEYRRGLAERRRLHDERAWGEDEDARLAQGIETRRAETERLGGEAMKARSRSDAPKGGPA